MSTDLTDLHDKMQAASDLGWQALSIGEFEQAARHYAEAANLANACDATSAEAVFLSYSALAHCKLGKLKDAELIFDKALDLAETAVDLRAIAHITYLQAELACSMKDESLAIGKLWRSLDMSLESKDNETAEVAFGKLGSIYRNRGWLESAAECFRQALEIRPEGHNRSAWLGNLGQTLSELGDTKAALDCFNRAHALIETADKDGLARCLSSEGLILFEQGKAEEAICKFEEALRLARESGDRISQGTGLGNLGNVYLSLGNVARAKDLCAEALFLSQESKDLRGEAAHTDSLGDCSMAEGKTETALNQYQSALELARKSADRQGERIYLANIGRALKELGRDEEAIAKLDLALTLFEEQRSKINSDNLKTLFASAGQKIYSDLIELCVKGGKRVQALEYVGRAKSRAMLDLLGNTPIDISDLNDVDNNSISALIAKEIELRSEISSLERMLGNPGATTKDDISGSAYISGSADSTKSDSSGYEQKHRGSARTADDVSNLYRHWRDVIDQLKRRHPAYASMVSVDSLDFASMSQLWNGALSPDAAILEFFWSDQVFVAAGIWNTAAEPILETLSWQESRLLEADLNDFLEMSSTEGWEVPTSLCVRLYNRLAKKVLDRLPGTIRRLVIVPHGILHKVPFAALHDGSQYLIERFAISLVPSSSIIAYLSSKGSQNAKKDKDYRYLVSAISDYSATREGGIEFSARLRSSAGLEDLGFTMEEGQTVFELVNQVSNDALLRTNEAVKGELMQRFAEFNVIHFAGHAVFNPEEPLASGLVLADGSVLTAARILQDARFRTQRGKLLVLSACQTGVNVITTGGEIIGLARALIYSGMPNLISSLWEVADRSTATLMEDFHKIWNSSDLSIAEALKQAQCQALKGGQPIHAWAPFIHLGID